MTDVFMVLYQLTPRLIVKSNHGILFMTNPVSNVNVTIKHRVNYRFRILTIQMTFVVI